MSLFCSQDSLGRCEHRAGGSGSASGDGGGVRPSPELGSLPRGLVWAEWRALAEMPSVPRRPGQTLCALPLVQKQLQTSRMESSLLSSQRGQEAVYDPRGESPSPQPPLYPAVMSASGDSKGYAPYPDCVPLFCICFNLLLKFLFLNI